jgi:hypothetical protein
MNTPATYDEAIRQAEDIVLQLEQTEALSVSDYKRKAAEVKQLLDFCEHCLKEMDYTDNAVTSLS